MKIPAAEEFNAPGHWFTSYPSLNHWTEDFGHVQFRESLMDYLDHEKWFGGVHLYVHIPFCAKLCHYCICNLTVTNNREKIQNFLNHLLVEIDNLRGFYGKQARQPNIREIHLGGGTPNHLDRAQFTQLIDGLATLTHEALDEYAMEIDPRLIKAGDLQFYASHGITRISFGVQDFDKKVQQAINRVQPFEMVKSVMKDRHHFKGVNFDLLYGLPFQSLKSVENTLDQVAELLPERITLLKYCHAPELRKHMKLIKVDDLPPPEELPVMFVTMAEKLMSLGYEWIGLDHFALSQDSLAVAARQQNLVRTFNGFKPGPTKMMIGLGPTSTSALSQTYAQNYYDLNQYYEAVKRGQFPVERGYKLTSDEQATRRRIFDLLCNLECPIHLDAPAWDRGVTGVRDELKRLCETGVITIRDDYPVSIIKVTDYGRILLRNVCSLFDEKDVKPEHMRIAQKAITRRAVESSARQSA